MITTHPIEFWSCMIVLSLFAFISIRTNWLTRYGAFGMVIMGMLIMLAFHYSGLFIIFIFFVSSNLISKVFKKSSKKIEQEPRTLIQVLANGGVPLISAVFVLLGGPYLFGLGCFLTSIAEAAADTWASEVGVIKGGKPYHLALKKQVESGLSGGVTLIGSLYGGFGALLIGLMSMLVYFQHSWVKGMLACVAIAIMGWAGQWIDTAFGAYCQARYECTACGILTDDPEHCDQPAKLVHGKAWMTNHLVNACSSVMTGILGGAIFFMWGGLIGVI